MKPSVRYLLIWVLTLSALFIGWRFVVSNLKPSGDRMFTLSELQDKVDRGEVESVVISGSDVTGVLRDKTEFHATVPTATPDLYKALRDHNVSVTLVDANRNLRLQYMMQLVPIVLVPLVFLLAIWLGWKRIVKQSLGVIGPGNLPPVIGLAELEAEIDQRRVKSVVINMGVLTGTRVDGSIFQASVDAQSSDLRRRLEMHGVDVRIVDRS